jgi:hypothetical protein
MSGAELRPAARARSPRRAAAARADAAAWPPPFDDAGCTRQAREHFGLACAVAQQRLEHELDERLERRPACDHAQHAMLRAVAARHASACEPCEQRAEVVDALGAGSEQARKPLAERDLQHRVEFDEAEREHDRDHRRDAGHEPVAVLDVADLLAQPGRASYAVVPPND